MDEKKVHRQKNVGSRFEKIIQWISGGTIITLFLSAIIFVSSQLSNINANQEFIKSIIEEKTNTLDERLNEKTMHINSEILRVGEPIPKIQTNVDRLSQTINREIIPTLNDLNSGKEIIEKVNLISLNDEIQSIQKRIENIESIYENFYSKVSVSKDSNYFWRSTVKIDKNGNVWFSEPFSLDKLKYIKANNKPRAFNIDGNDFSIVLEKCDYKPNSKEFSIEIPKGYKIIDSTSTIHLFKLGKDTTIIKDE